MKAMFFRLKDTERTSIVFGGISFLLEKIKNEISACAFKKEIMDLTFITPKEGALIPIHYRDGFPLVIIKGHPLAIETIKEMVIDVLGSITERATYTYELLTSNPDYRDIISSISYFGLRRGDVVDRRNDIAVQFGARLAGIHAFSANVGAFLTSNDKRNNVFDTMEIQVAGTSSHSFMMILSTILVRCKREVFDDNIFGFSDEILEILDRDTNENNININDFFSFCVYLKTLYEAEKERNMVLYKICLVDTIDTIQGINSAILASKCMGIPMTGIRLDTRPEKYIYRALEILDRDYFPHFPDNHRKTFKIFCTDSIDIVTYNRIIGEIKRYENDYGHEIGIGIGLGIGTSIANRLVPNIECIQTDIDYNSYEYTWNFYNMKNKIGNESRNELGDESGKQKHALIPADTYAFIQWALLERINKKLK